MAIADPTTGESIYASRPDDLFVAASSMKIFIAGTAFDALGAGHRFRTAIRRTGPVVHGTLRGDLVLSAGGDLLLSGRMQPDGTLLLPDPDPTYPGGAPLPDPFREIRGLALRVHEAGIRRIEGRVVVDTSLFTEAREGIALGNAQITVSPMMVNDHVIHAAITPAPTIGALANVAAMPATAYLRFTSQVTTVDGTTRPRPLTVSADASEPDGTHTVTITGDIKLNDPTSYVQYYVPEPAHFAGIALAEQLRAVGVAIPDRTVDHSLRHVPGAPVTEHVSPPLADEVKVMLKASSNVHTVTFPYLVGAIAGRDPNTPKATYDQYRRALFRAAGIDPDPTGASEGYYTPDTYLRFLAYVRRQPYFASMRDAMPIMGRDGTLAGNQPDSPAAGHVYAKTGTGMMLSPGSTSTAVLHKALAGYIGLPDGRWLTFAQFMHQSASQDTAMALGDEAQEAMAEIATAVYETQGAR